MGAKLGTGAGPQADMNLTPLIDIVLVVLIIMMVSIPIQVEKMGVKLPGRVEVQTKSDVPVEQLVVAVYEDGSLALNRKIMTEDVLFEQVSRRLRPLEKKQVFIDAHPEASYPAVVAMMDMARAAGAAQVGLARLKEEGPLPATSVAVGSRPKGVMLGNPSVMGAMDVTDADAAFQPLMGSVNSCYDQGLASHPDLTGRVLVRVSVGPDGQHMSEKIALSTIGDEAVETCILELLPAIEFQPLGYDDEGTGLTAIVQYPLLFSPG